MKFINSWQEYKDNWADLWQCLTNWPPYGYSVPVVGIICSVVVGVPCCLIGLAPSEED
mgnify:FL=1